MSDGGGEERAQSVLSRGARSLVRLELGSPVLSSWLPANHELSYSQCTGLVPFRRSVAPLYESSQGQRVKYGYVGHSLACQRSFPPTFFGALILITRYDIATDLWLEIGELCTTAAKDGNVRVVVLASALDKIFTAGLDVSAL